MTSVDERGPLPDPLASASRPQPWTHPPLRNAANQIRLIALDIPADDEAPIACTTSTHSLTDAPPHNAISYTWGTLQTNARTVLIDGRPFAVSQNCYYALWQARLHEPATPLWIDSICINQKDLQEKGRQVAMMGRIYHRASRVFACVGWHTPSSRYLQDVVTAGELAAAFDPALAIGSPEWNACLPSLPLAAVVELARNVKDFVLDRSYLSRLWVAQELYEARGRVSVLCQRDSMSWVNWQKLVFLAGPYFDLTGTPRPPDTALPEYFLAMSDLVNTREVVTFPEILVSARVLQCKDPMDRIYGILRLIDWEADGLEPMVPDYGLRPRDLAIKAMDYAPRKTLANAEHIVRALEVDIEPADLLATAVSMG